MAAEITTQGGGYSQIAAEQLAGVGGDFGKGALGAARSEFEEFQARAGTGAGFEGQLGWGFMQGDRGEKAFGKDMMDKIKSNPKMMNVFNMMSASEMEKDDTLLTGYAEELAGEDGDIDATKTKILEGLKEKDIFKQSRTQGGEDMLKQYNEAAEAAGGVGELLKTKEGRSLKRQITEQRAASYGKDFLSQGVLRREKETGLAAGITSDGTGSIGDIEDSLIKDTGRAAEAEKSSRAIGEKLKIDEIAKWSESFIKAAKNNTEGAEVIAAQFKLLTETIKEKNGDLEGVLTTLEKQLEQLSDKMSEGGFNVAKPK